MVGHLLDQGRRLQYLPSDPGPVTDHDGEPKVELFDGRIGAPFCQQGSARAVLNLRL